MFWKANMVGLVAILFGIDGRDENLALPDGVLAELGCPRPIGLI
jgi:hypothetical protein